MNDPDRVAAIETRFRARLSWMVLAAVAVLRWSMGDVPPVARGLVLAAACVLFVALNVPTVQVLRRARRERIALAGWAPIGVALLIRCAACLATIVLMW